MSGNGRAAAIFTVAACLCLFACRSSHNSPKLIVLGVDGMDPGFVEAHWRDLPNLAKLRDQGYFGPLQTTFPPQSPVAWSTFITGLKPGEHGMFDFVHRDPKTLLAFSSMSRTEPPGWTLPLGPYRIPLSASHVVALRKGTAFWQVLADHGIPVTIIRMPANYPPVAAGNALSGMGTPDLRGTQGTFTFYTDDSAEMSRAVSGGQIVKVHVENGHAVLPVEGPPNSLRKDDRYTSINLTFDVDRDNPVARIAAGQELVILREGEWSDWLAADFPLIHRLASVRGIFRVFVKQLHPRFEVYVSPINIDPISPALPVSEPPHFARTIARQIGRFFTLGIPEDTSALRQQVLSLPEFRSQAELVTQEERKLLRNSLHNFSGGLLFFYFSSIDQNSHVLWGQHDDELLKVYREVDESVGEVRRAFPSVQLVILSDHGFTTFDRAVHLNTWLKNRGFLTLNTSLGDGLGNVDWSLTQAYAIGLNGLYLNRAGREVHGIVQSGNEARALAATLRQELLAWRDPVDGRQIVETLYEEKASPQNAEFAPDFIVGYARGYRASWQTALGGTPPLEIEDNTDAWIADHCVNPADVPGVLFSSSPMNGTKTKIQDVTRFILRFFGV